MSANYFDEENEVPRIQDAAKCPGIQHKDKVLENKILKLGRFRKHNATPNRDVTCLGMAWARLPENREVASA